MLPTSFAVFLSCLSRRRFLRLLAVLLLLGLPGTTRSQKHEDSAVYVLTNHNDNARTGANKTCSMPKTSIWDPAAFYCYRKEAGSILNCWWAAVRRAKCTW